MPDKSFLVKNIIASGALLLSVFCLAATPLRADENYPEKINLSRSYAIEMSIRKNIDLRIEAISSSMTENDYERSWGIYNPVLALNGSGGVTATAGDPFFDTKSGMGTLSLTQFLPTGGSVAGNVQSGFTNTSISTSGTVSSSWQSSAGLTLTQPLLKNFGRDTAELTITLAANTVQDSLERFRFVTADTVMSTITAYNHLYTLKQILDSRAQALKSAQSLLEDIKKKPQTSPQQAMELANAEYAVVQRRKDMVDAGRNVSDQEATLRYLIGIETKTSIVAIDPPSREEPKETVDQAITGALANRLDLRQQYLALKSSQLQERVSRHQSLPDLSVNASGGATGTGGNFAHSFEYVGSYWTVGLQFSYPFGNTAAHNDYLRNKARTEQVRTQIKAMEWRIRNDVEADMRALISARIQMQMADKSSQLAGLRLEEYRKNNLAGTATVQDVINAENDLTFARNSQTEAVESFANSVARLWRDMGVLLERQRIHVETIKPKNLLDSEKAFPLPTSEVTAPPPQQ